jgi:hypothetical protein
LLTLAALPVPTPVEAPTAIVLRCSASKADWYKNQEPPKTILNPTSGFSVYLAPSEGPVKFDPVYPWSGIPSSSYVDTSRGTAYLPERLEYKYGYRQPLSDGQAELTGTLSIDRKTLKWALHEISSIMPSKTTLWTHAVGTCWKEKMPSLQF